MTTILLIDADSTIPNIALMKLSTYHKSMGHDVFLYRHKLPYYPHRKKHKFVCPTGYDKVYCSVIFEGNAEYITGKNIQFGGTGVSLDRNLPDFIDSLECDYSIYPENTISYGFITRGCIRKCAFCKVPKKEGYIHKYSDIDRVVKHRRVKFLDNNILAYKNHGEIFEELIRKGIRLQFNQGLDIRLLTKDNSEQIRSLNYFGEYVFAFDNWALKPLIEEKLALLRWVKPWGVKFFMYVHPDMPLQHTVNRILWAKQRGYLPYIMRDISCWGHRYAKFFIDICAYCNQAGLFKSLSFEEFLDKRAISDNRREAHSVLWAPLAKNFMMEGGLF